MKFGRAASSIYVNVCSGEATTQFPDAQQMARGGVSFSLWYLELVELHLQMSKVAAVSDLVNYRY